MNRLLTRRVPIIINCCNPHLRLLLPAISSAFFPPALPHDRIPKNETRIFQLNYNTDKARVSPVDAKQRANQRAAAAFHRTALRLPRKQSMVACFFAGGAVTLAAACSRNARLDSSCRFSCSKSSMSRAAATLSTKTLQARVNGRHSQRPARSQAVPRRPCPQSPPALTCALLARRGERGDTGLRLFPA